MIRTDQTDSEKKGMAQRAKLVRGMVWFGVASLALIAVFLLIWLMFKPTLAQAQEKPPLQGPEAGQIVAPPARDVTPSYQLSPLHQSEPLTRIEGNPLPPKPKLEPLPPIFRKVVVEGPTRLTLYGKRNREVTVTLAHVTAPDEGRICWFAGQEAPCLAMATTALKRFIRRRAIGCDWVSDPGEGSENQDIEEARDARCYLGAGLKDRKAGETNKHLTDLAGWMVRFGWAEPIGGHYADEQQEAMDLARGIHASEESSNSEHIRAQKEEMKALSAEIDAVANAIEPAAEPAEDDKADALTLMELPIIDDENPVEGEPPTE